MQLLPTLDGSGHVSVCPTCSVVPTEEQEYPEQRFLSDLYFADIFDSEGVFSSWDSNNDDNFAV